MLRLLVCVAFFVSAGAFTFKANPIRANHVVKMQYENEIGAQPPLGFWDPLGLLKNADRARFDRLRYVETKHGRICMLAILGHMVTTAGFRMPGEISPGVPFSSIRAGLAAFQDIPPLTLTLLFVFIGALELGFGVRQEEIEEAQLKASGWDEATIRRKMAIELNNGRAAMMGIFGLMIHEKLDNNPYIINSLLGYPVPFNQ